MKKIVSALRDSKAVTIRCPACVSNSEVELIDCLKSLESKVDKLDEVPKTITTAIENATDQQKPPTWAQRLVKSTKNPPPKVTTLTKAMVNNAVKAANKDEERERSLVITGVPESSGPNGPPTPQDNQTVVDIFSEIMGSEESADLLNFDWYRINRAPRQDREDSKDTARLIKVKFSIKADRDYIFKHKHKLAGSEKFSKIFIQPALTRESSKRLSELRQKCRENNEFIHGEDWRNELEKARRKYSVRDGRLLVLTRDSAEDEWKILYVYDKIKDWN